MRIRHLLVATLTAVSLAGCTPPVTVETPTPTATSTSTEVSPPSPSPTSNVAWTPSGQAVDPAGYTDEDGGIIFASPSGNVQCGYSTYSEPGWWWCLLKEQGVELPPAPDGDCTGSYVDGSPIVPTGFWMDPSDPDALPQTFCAGAGDATALAYGSSITYRDMGCDSTEDGMTCRSLVSGHGFRLSRSDYEIF